MAKIVAKTYGDALFAQAAQAGRQEAVWEEASRLLEVLEQHPELDKLLGHPGIPKQDKQDVVQKSLQGVVGPELLGLLTVMLAKDRYRHLAAVLEYFGGRVKEAMGIGVAYVSTALPLRPEQREAVEKKLLATGGYTRMEMHYTEDESLIGGMVIRIKDRVVDNSIKSQLAGLTKQLLQIQLGMAR